MQRATEAVAVAAAEAEAPPRRGRLAWLHAVPHEWARAWAGAAAPAADEPEAPPPPLPRLLREAHAGTQRTAAPERDARRRRSGSRGAAAAAS
jgi:hypothetical protein